MVVQRAALSINLLIDYLLIVATVTLLSNVTNGGGAKAAPHTSGGVR